MWSAMSNSDPPSSTQRRTASISSAVNAGRVGNDSDAVPVSPAALATTGMSMSCNRSSVNGADQFMMP
jgi:hypothetical protein